jgi:hypothetical protein
MAGQFDKESSVKNFEWHRERTLREVKKGVTALGANKIDWNLRAVAKKHGEQAARELARELRSR